MLKLLLSETSRWNVKLSSVDCDRSNQTLVNSQVNELNNLLKQKSEEKKHVFDLQLLAGV